MAHRAFNIVRMAMNDSLKVGLVLGGLFLLWFFALRDMERDTPLVAFIKFLFQ